MEYFHSGSPWEGKVGYSRAVKAGQVVYVSGTTAINENGDIVGVGDAYTQTRQCLLNISRALAHFDCDMSSVFRTRIYVTNIELWRDIGRAHAEFFSANKGPATSMVEVSRLISEQMLVEIEAEAYFEF